ncbi:MAG: radical SAM family heme chaperone HemW [Hallerella porci]|uniref:radical SAM family heme chaperone HemW n=1 Tax=Hallerella porci TaxID=1945871 RepID=UPI000D0771B9|nr:radical SAM family heme chaperone HemW [Hallerella porci]MDY3922384.1 radical SAM family heme chaperone HemW [Hallerella porci]
MNSLYVHIPFCSKICGYCDFSTVGGAPRLFAEYVDLLLREAEERFAKAGNFVQNFQTVYFGGGTPSVLPLKEFSRLVRGLENLGVKFSQMREVDWECNPDSATEEIVENAISLGVNRISLGIQSFDNRILAEIGRRGSAEQAREALQRLQNFQKSSKSLRLTADLMFWLPKQTLEDFERDVKELADSGIGHVSFYGLILNPKTVLGKKFAQKKLDLDEDLYPKMYRAGVKILENAGIERYEVSNFAKIGEESLHNRNYWLRGEYIGLGPSAHSFRESVRAAAPAKFNAWKNWVLAGAEESAMEIDRLGKQERIEEKIWLSLRTREGLDLQRLEFEEFTKIPEQKIARWEEKGYLKRDENRLILQGDGWLWMDEIVSDFI